MLHGFGLFEFDDMSLELRKSGRLVRLEPQPARALALLLQRAGETVTREDLRLAVWGSDTHVDFDRGIAYCLSQIRAALGDKGDNPRFVQTLPRRGYSFVAPVRPAAQPLAPAPPSAQTPRSWRRWLAIAAVVIVAVAIAGWTVVARHGSATRRVVVAVSVFDNETGLPEYDQLVSGISDVVVVRLSEIAPARIAVVGNAAVLRQPRNIRNLKAVAEGVRADYVVLGQLQRDTGGFRFITHLVRLSDETHLRANRLMFGSDDLPALESKVVAEFERAVRQHVLGS